MGELGFEAHRAEIDALFDSWDPDGSGFLELGARYSRDKWLGHELTSRCPGSAGELTKILRRGGAVTLGANLQAGAMGKIETKAINKSRR